jgi:hypothetical protein
MSYLARLKEEISLKEPRGELTEPTKAPSVSFVSAAYATSRDNYCDDSEKWREFESLLEVVAPAYNTPAHELDGIREAARNDLASALVAYRLMAKEVRGDSK